MPGSRASALGVLAAVGFVLVAVWGVVNLSEGDWFIGGGMLASAVIGLWSLVVRMLQERRRRAPRSVGRTPGDGEVARDPTPHQG